MATFGSKSGSLYPLGPLVVATPGTPVPLSQNVSILSDFGATGNTDTIVANQLILSTVGASNSGLMYLVFKGAGASAQPNSVIVALAPGTVYTLNSPQLSNIFYLGNYAVDADTAGGKMYITAVIV
jgi:hypothetical protein